MVSWGDVRGKIKEAYDKIEYEYRKIEANVGKVKEHAILNTLVKIALPNIPVVGQYLLDWYDKAGGAYEDKTKQLLQFLQDLQQQSEEQFNRISEDLKTNVNSIISSKIEITQLISKRSSEILDELHRVGQDTTIIRQDVREVKQILQTQQGLIQITYAKKPSTFRGEKSIFIGRQNYVDKIKEYFTTSNYPISLIGPGGIGKSALAFRAIHQCEAMFDLIIPVYFESGITIISFLSLLVKSLNLSIDEFEKLDFEEQKQVLIDTLKETKKHPLIFADNYETISSKTPPTDDFVQINAFLKRIPANTSVLLTSQFRKNLDGERHIQLDGLTLHEGRELFIELAGDYLTERSEGVCRAIENIVHRTAGHPLSIEILARSYEGSGLKEIENMFKHLGLHVDNPWEEDERLSSLKACFDYSINNLADNNLNQLLSKLTLFKSPFAISAVVKIFEVDEVDIIRLFNRSLLVRIESDEYGKIENEDYWLYTFHPALRNYLKDKLNGTSPILETEYGEKFSEYYKELLVKTYDALTTQDRMLSIRRFNLIIEAQNNDFDRAIELTKNLYLKSNVANFLGLTLDSLGSLTAAHQYYLKALEFDTGLNDRVGMAGDYGNIGILLYYMGNLQEAFENTKKTVTIYEEENIKDNNLATGYVNMGIILKGMGKYEEALEYHNKAVSIHVKQNDGAGLAADCGNMGVVFQCMANYEKALMFHNKSLWAHGKLNDKIGMARDYMNMGVVLNHKGNHQEALGFHTESLAIFEELTDKVGMAISYGCIGDVYYSMGNFKEAMKSFSKSLTMLQDFEKKTGYHDPSIEMLENKLAAIAAEEDR